MKNISDSLGKCKPITRAQPRIEAPFTWQSKVVLGRIREAFDSEGTVSSAIGVYVALTEIASDSHSSEFITTHAWISQKSGLSLRTIQARLSVLTEIGLVHIVTPTMRAPAHYKLLSVRQPLPNDKQPLPNVRQRTISTALPTYKETKESGITTKTTKLPRKKLSPQQKELADEIEGILGEQWFNDAGKWIKRIKTQISKVRRVFAEVGDAIKESRIETTNAQYAEQQWKEFR